MALHKNLTEPDIHIPYAYTYANAAARTGASGFVSADLGKFARQTDDNTIWMLTATTPTWVQVSSAASTPPPPPILLWGNSNVSGTTTTRYLTPGYTDATAPTSAVQFRVPSAGTVRKLRVRQNVGAGNGNNIVYTVRKNGSAQALAVTIASTSQDGSDLSNTFTVAAGDLLDIEVTKASSVGTSPSNVTATVEIAA